MQEKRKLSISTEDLIDLLIVTSTCLKPKEKAINKHIKVLSKISYKGVISEAGVILVM